MNQPHKRILSIAPALLALCAGLAGCSPGGDDAPAATPEAEISTESVAPAEPEWAEILRNALTSQSAPGDAELVEALTGNVDPTTNDGFVELPVPLASRNGMFVRHEAADALIRMHEAATADGVNLIVISAFRSMRDQTRIWNNKWTGATLVEGGALPETIPAPNERALKILEYSSMPGTSRHHWGTDVDLNNLNNEWFDTHEGARVYDWLSQNAADFGFCQVYSEKSAARPTGYELEKWHWSYMPLASKFLSAYPQLSGYSNLSGFEGADQAAAIDVITDFVGGIAPDCAVRWPAQPTDELQSQDLRGRH